MEAQGESRQAIRSDLWLFVGLAAVFRAAFLVVMPRVIDSADAIHYIEVAREFAGGRFLAFDPNIPVLYPLLCAGFHWIVPDLELAGRAVSLVASALLVVPVYLLSRDLHGRHGARIAALTVSIWPWLADYGCRVAPEALMASLWFLSVWVFSRAMRAGGLWLAAAPVAFFALHLARPEGTFLLLLAPIAGIILCAGKERRKLRRLVPYVVVCALLLIGYALFMRAVSGEASISHRARDLGATAHFIFGVRGIETVRTFSKFFSEVLPIMLGPYLLVFAGVGLFRRTRHPRDLRLEFFVMFFALAQGALAVLSTYPEPRYLMPVIIAIALWAARGMALVSEQACAVTRGRFLAALPVTGMMLLMAFGTAMAVAPEYLGRTPREPREYKIAGLWMKEHLEPGTIITRKPQVGYYAEMDAPLGPADDDTVADVLARAKAVGGRYLVIDERYTTKIAPGMRPLLDPKNVYRGLRLVAGDLSPYAEARIVIYEIIDAEAVPVETGEADKGRGQPFLKKGVSSGPPS